MELIQMQAQREKALRKNEEKLRVPWENIKWSRIHVTGV
jgi:hypothetical protein